MKFLTKVKLGKKRSLTPEGFLLVEDVPLARTGTQIYGPGETPVSSKQGKAFVSIHRTADEVFRVETMASIAGKPITDAHPNQPVTPKTWRTHARGVVLNPRRGDAEHLDFMVGDLLITDADTIRKVQRNEIREVSCGYEAEYDELAPGEGRQRNIVYNHLALVPRGRCGTSCALGDNATTDGAIPMAQKTWVQRIREAINGDDEVAIKAVLDAAEADQTTGSPAQTIINVGSGTAADAKTRDCSGGDNTAAAFDAAAFDTRMKGVEKLVTDLATVVGDIAKKLTPAAPAADAVALDAEAAALATALENEAPVGKGKEARTVKDSSLLADAHQDAIAGTEILSPGARVPAFDKAADPKVTLAAIHALRRTALDAALTNTESKGVIESLIGGRPVASLTNDEARVAFRSAVYTRKQANQPRSPVPLTTDRNTGSGPAKMTLSAYNKKLAEHYKPGVAV